MYVYIGSKLVYSTKIGTPRLLERQALLNDLLQYILAMPLLWNHAIVHQFLCLQPTASSPKPTIPKSTEEDYVF